MAPMCLPEAHSACQLSGSVRCDLAELWWPSCRSGETVGIASLFSERWGLSIWANKQLAIVEVKCLGFFSPSASKYAAFQKDIHWISPGRESCLRKNGMEKLFVSADIWSDGNVHSQLTAKSYSPLLTWNQIITICDLISCDRVSNSRHPVSLLWCEATDTHTCWMRRMTLTTICPSGLLVAVKDILRGGYASGIKVQAVTLGLWL